MNQPNEIYGAVLEGGSAVLMARVAFADGTLVAPSDINTITYRIDRRGSCSSAQFEPVAGHTEVVTPTITALTASLQTEPTWDVDGVGYNFRHEIDVTGSPAFASAGCKYAVRYTLTPSIGQPIVVRFLIEAI